MVFINVNPPRKREFPLTSATSSSNSRHPSTHIGCSFPLLLCMSGRESPTRGKPILGLARSWLQPQPPICPLLLSSAALNTTSWLSQFIGNSEVTMPEVEGEPTSLLDLIVSLLPDAVEDITYLVDMEGEGLCLHQIQAEEERTTLEDAK